MTTKTYNRCVEQWADGLYRFVVGILKDCTRAQDVVQESYTRLWQNRNLVHVGSEKSYLFTIAYNLSISDLRYVARRSTIELDNAINHSTNTEWDNMHEIVWRAINSLGEKQRTAIMLSDWEGYSIREIAQIMDITEGQVKISIHRGRLKLRDILQDEAR